VPTRSRPLLIFDGDCHFCRRFVSRWRGATGDRVEYAPYQEVASRFPEIPDEDFRRAVVLLEIDGGVYRGAEAVFRALSHAPGGGWGLSLYGAVPGFSAVSEAAYRFVARHRTGFSRATRCLWGAHLERPTYLLTRRLFLRLLGAIYFIAFLSLGVQIPGLIGRHGILPSGEFLRAVSASLGPERFRILPTLCWLNPSDGFLTLLWAGGAVLGLLLAAGVAQGPVLALLWAFYLSLSCVCRDFLSFQWDILLLETGFLAIFLAPWRPLSRLARDAPPSPVMVGLLRWLLFRLMFASGMVKLTSGDPTWWNLTALEVHYETQPLPTWLGWYAHQLPELFQRASAALMFGVELLVPFLIFFPRRPRMVAAGAISGLMLLIALTGNYGYFNLLAVALCVMLLDDACLIRFHPRGTAALLAAPQKAGPGLRVRRVAVGALAVLLIPLSCMSLARCLRRPVPWPEPMRLVEAYLSPLRLVGSYGLFARMTTVRNEIIVEGSNDGTTWLPYEFKWKPGDPSRAPGFVEPHMPRLDWQMWFAALSNFRSQPWFQNFLVRLLQGSPQVLALMGENPFPGAPPRLIRARLYEYHFTDLTQRGETGNWWRREERGIYFPQASLK
jgi:predicted DCC family thiol-disulfide oxidoreductase YuxK